MDLPEVLQWIAGGRKTGTLHLDRGAVQKRIAFLHGIIHTSWSNDPRESLGQFLIRDQLVTEEQLFTALLRQEKEGRLIGVILVGDGAVSEDDLRRALQLKVGETIYDLFLWPEGNFRVQGRRDAGAARHRRGAPGDGRDHGGRAARRRVVAHPRGVPERGHVVHGGEGHSRRPRPRGTAVPRPRQHRAHAGRHRPGDPALGVRYRGPGLRAPPARPARRGPGPRHPARGRRHQLSSASC